jgi:hypothetical protein
LILVSGLWQSPDHAPTFVQLLDQLKNISTIRPVIHMTFLQSDAAHEMNPSSATILGFVLYVPMDDGLVSA